MSNIMETRRKLDAEYPDLVREPGEECLATFWRQATPGTTFWRCEIPARYLPGQMFGFTAEDFRVENDKVEMPRQRGVAVWQFLGDVSRTQIAFHEMRNGTRTLMEVDDNYLRPSPYKGAWARTHEEAEKTGIGYSHEGHRLLTPHLDGVICSTEYLVNQYMEFNDTVYHCPNSVDPADWDIPRHDDDVLRIGYYGSQSHARDWPHVKKALKWAQRQPGVEVLLLGFTPPGWSGLTLPWSHDLKEARANLGQLDIGVCPLQPGDWADGKSDVKAMEYAMAGVMPIVSRTEPYRPWWDYQRYEFTAQGEKEWDEVIRHVVRNRDKVKEWAAQAKEYVLEERTIQDNIWRWREAVNG